MRIKIFLIVVLLIIGFSVAQPASAQLPELSGVSDFLCGFWKSSKGEMTQIILHNPTAVSRDAVLLYYDEDQKFVNCQVMRLTPHDFELVKLVFPTAPPDFDQVGSSGYVLQGQGVVEIRSAPVVNEDPNHPGGLIGYVQMVQGEIMDKSPSEQTRGIAPLFPVDTKLFTPFAPIPGQYDSIRKCVCEKLGALKSPQKLKTIFCTRVE